MENKIPFEIRVTARIAFSHERTNFIENWIGAQKVNLPENMQHWAKRIQELNDAELIYVGPQY